MSRSTPKRQASAVHRTAPTLADLKNIQQRSRQRRAIANAVTLLMLLLTLLVLAWVAYQVNNPVAIDLSHLFTR